MECFFSRFLSIFQLLFATFLNSGSVCAHSLPIYVRQKIIFVIIFSYDVCILGRRKLAIADASYRTFILYEKLRTGRGAGGGGLENQKLCGRHKKTCPGENTKTSFIFHIFKLSSSKLPIKISFPARVKRSMRD